MKYLVMWELDITLFRPELVRLVAEMPAYGQKLIEKKSLSARYHVVGKHGGAWIFDVPSHEELERLLAASPVYNFARYQVIPLAEMEGPDEVLRRQQG